MIRRLVNRVEVGDDRVVITLGSEALASFMNRSIERLESVLRQRLGGGNDLEMGEDDLRVVIRGPLKRSRSFLGVEHWDQSDQRGPKPSLDRALVKALVRAHIWRDMIEAGEITNFRQLAKKADLELVHVRELLRLAFLAPRIQQTILLGSKRGRVTLKSVATITDDPHCADQLKRAKWRAPESPDDPKRVLGEVELRQGRSLGSL